MTTKHERGTTRSNATVEGDTDAAAAAADCVPPPEKKQKGFRDGVSAVGTSSNATAAPAASTSEEVSSPTERVASPAQQQHFKMYKPPKVLTQFVHTARRRKKRKLLGDYYHFPESTMAIGRLDEDSEGLLLLTTDGKVSERVRDKAVEKEYYCQVDGTITQDAVDKMKGGLEISVQGTLYSTLPCMARIIACSTSDDSGQPIPNDIPHPVRKIRDARHGPTSWVSVTVTEGKFRQVRKMTAAVGYPTLRLVRVRVADIDLGGLAMGEVRPIDIDI
eukprot:CAMPEP_0178496678 /NCGR_PEP_ID=MMETSP0696-20121128/14251_1 /TAXON_ID=265572 /ORGANISM="Extubocellulus spinifer, Strain CCMP396" /LENGTH=275 /DNA_ID=CAMNT_0020124989 /DNA_START=1422 /DNA_END=2249 /DNA_ORIENTATION=-